MKQQNGESSSTIVLYPPRIVLDGRSDKYKLIFNVKWGDFTKEVVIDRETPGMYAKLTNEINMALLEGSETNPYLVK